jgi:hypothetical protein
MVVTQGRTRIQALSCGALSQICGELILTAFPVGVDRVMHQLRDGNLLGGTTGGFRLLASLDKDRGGLIKPQPVGSFGKSKQESTHYRNLCFKHHKNDFSIRLDFNKLKLETKCKFQQ